MIIKNVSFRLGTKNFCWDIEYMLKRKVGIYWRISWSLVTPIVLIFILIYFLVSIERLKYDKYDYPDSALGELKIKKFF